MPGRAAGLWTALGVSVLAATIVTAQTPEPLPIALTQMIDTERAFAARAVVIGWKQSFLEYFALTSIGFDGGQAGPAREQLEKSPDPPPDLQLIWEPRYGDVSASGEIGYLTGPVQNIRASRDNGKPRYSNYASIWKRQRDGSFKVVMDVGIPTPGPVAFAAGFTRLPQKNRFTGDYDDSTPPLSAADEVLNSALRTGQARAYRPHLAEGARLHRANRQPMVGPRAISQWLASQPPMTTADSKFSEAARSGDLGYTWGTYSIAPRRTVTAKPGDKATQTIDAEAGFYVRVWVRERNGQWKIALDVLQ